MVNVTHEVAKETLVTRGITAKERMIEIIPKNQRRKELINHPTKVDKTGSRRTITCSVTENRMMRYPS